jgi:hypothetical protein
MQNIFQKLRCGSNRVTPRNSGESSGGSGVWRPSYHRCIQDGLKEEEDEERAPPRKEHENNNWYPLSYFWRGYLDL